MDLTNEQWDLIMPLLPEPRPPGGRGRPPSDQRRILDGILWKLRSGLPWCELPSCYGSHEACFLYYTRWQHGGLIKRIRSALIKDAETRGNFDMKNALINGVVKFIPNGRSNLDIYILAPYVDMWQVSAAMLLFRQVLDYAVKGGSQP
jgi:transposase